MHTLARPKVTFSHILTAVVIAHGLFMLLKFKTEIAAIKFPERTDAIKVTFLPDSLPTQAPTAAASKLKQQIVQSEDSASSEKPKSAAFLSDKDRSFDRQSIARRVDTFQQMGKGNAAVNQVAQKGDVKPKQKTQPKEIKLSDLGFASADPLPKEVSRGPASVESTKGIESGDPNFKGLSATNDYVEEVGLGDFTQLNTVEFKFYGFYHRIRQKLEQFWGRSIQEKAHQIFRQGRRLPASDNYITSLRISMNEKGEIVGVQVMGSSGVRELDDAAIESFNKAGPFPNPPSELLVNGTATIEWGFVVKS